MLRTRDTSIADDIDLAHPSSSPSVRELVEGLEQTPARIAAKFFYDELGSKLFETICETEEYYPTRAEAEIVATHRAAIAAAVGPGASLIDLGAGNCAKAARLFRALKPARYVPVDISGAFLHQCVRGLEREFPDIPMAPVVLDFTQALDLPEDAAPGRALFFYPGSSIGNFSPAEAHAFLARIRARCAAGRDSLLIGVDLVKDSATLEAAYDDALGVTAAFNLNVLRHANRIMDANFDVRDWRHVALFDRAASRIEMHLQARRRVAVSWPGGGRIFAAGERIHTENSYKYTRPGFAGMLERAGFGDIESWTDAQNRFLVCHARAR